MEKKLTPKEAAEIIGYCEKTLYRWRQKGIGPEWVREENGRIAYRKDLIDEWDDSVWSMRKKRA